MWGLTVTLGGYKLYFADPQAGQVAIRKSWRCGFARPQDRAIAWADGTEHKVNPPFDQPFSFFIAEPFKIVDGKINRIEALVTPVPYGMPTGWAKK